MIKYTHRLNELNIWAKFHKSLKRLWDIEWTWKQRAGHKTFMCDLHFGLRWLHHVLCTLSQWAKHLSQVFWKTFKGCRRYRADTEMKVRTHDLEVGPWPWVEVTILCYLHIVSMSLTFETSFQEIFGRVLEMEWTWDSYGQTNGGHSYNPPPPLQWGIIKNTLFALYRS